jgi:hypothetical protein
VRLCRWVLLKNSISSAVSRAVPERSPSVSPPRHTAPYHKEPPPAPDDAEVFVFPDGDIFAEFFVSDSEESPEADMTDTASEAQWLDSLLESLADEDDADFEHDPDDELISLSDISTRSVDGSSSTQIAPETVFLPPSPPLLPTQCTLYRYQAPHLHTSDLPPLPRDDDIEEFSLPDVMEDSASDTDTESISTPESRSMSSLNDGPSRGPLIRIVDEAVHAPALPPFNFFPLRGFTSDEFTQEC